MRDGLRRGPAIRVVAGTVAVREQVTRLRLLCGMDTRKAVLLDLCEPEGHVSFALDAVASSELPVPEDH
jgi:hypothetical protein